MMTSFEQQRDKMSRLNSEAPEVPECRFTLLDRSRFFARQTPEMSRAVICRL